MSNDLKHLFSFNRSERNAILILIVILAAVFAYPYFTDYKNRTDSKQSWNKYLDDINRLEASVKSSHDSLDIARQLNFQQMDRSMALIKLNPFPFDPNTLPAEQWSRMGLSDKQIKTIKNYLAKGGKFYTKEDFRKMYCIKQSEYEVLAPYISITIQKPVYAANQTAKANSEAPRATKQKVLIDINTADSAKLTELYGIGPSFAKRIVKYRKMLGGFYTKNQLLEVYGFDQSKLDQISDYITLNVSEITKININSVSTDVLKKHPYFDYYTAKSVVDNRIANGRYTSVDQLKNLPLMHADLFEKIKNYIAL